MTDPSPADRLESLESVADPVHDGESAPTPPPWSDDADAELVAALVEFADALAGVWREPDFPRLITRSTEEKAEAVTTAADSAPRLPGTGCPLRGHDGVAVEVRTTHTVESADFAREWARVGVFSRGVETWRTPVPEPSEAWRRLIAAREAAAITMLQTPTLGIRLSCAAGRRVDPVAAIADELRVAPAAYVDNVRMILYDLLPEAAAAVGLVTGDHCRAFDRPTALADALRDRLVALARRTEFRYQAVAYLNGPALDGPAADPDRPLTLYEEYLYGDAGPDQIRIARVALVPATNALLSRAAVKAPYAGFRLPTGLERCNTALVVDLALSVEAAPNRFYDLYPAAVVFAEAAVEALRLARPEDLGISHVEISGAESPAPWGPTAEYVDTGNRAAEWTPRRPTYAPASATPLTPEEAKAVRTLAPVTLLPPKVPGLAVARRRFRDAYERYAADDPERLLDIAIALEALLLNDQPSKSELGFRMAVRAARLLGRGFDERQAVAKAVTDVYAARSRLAHGGAVDPTDGRPAKVAAERAKAAAALAAGGTLLRRTLREVLTRDDLAGLDLDALRAWWQRVELG